MDAEHENILETFNDSLETCNQDERFMDTFYSIFTQASPEIAEKFRHTDMAKQKRILRLSLYLLLMAAQGKPEGDAHLKRIASLHDHTQLDIQPHLYSLWLDCLLKTVQQCDPGFNQHTEQAWRYIMQKGIDFMIAHY